MCACLCAHLCMCSSFSAQKLYLDGLGAMAPSVSASDPWLYQVMIIPCASAQSHDLCHAEIMDWIHWILSRNLVYLVPAPRKKYFVDAVLLDGFVFTSLLLLASG